MEPLLTETGPTPLVANCTSVAPSTFGVTAAAIRVDAETNPNPLVVTGPTAVCRTEPEESVICWPSSAMSSCCAERVTTRDTDADEAVDPAEETVTGTPA